MADCGFDFAKRDFDGEHGDGRLGWRRFLVFGFDRRQKAATAGRSGSFLSNQATLQPV
jgi:hypothetical protein